MNWIDFFVYVFYFTGLQGINEWNMERMIEELENQVFVRWGGVWYFINVCAEVYG